MKDQDMLVKVASVVVIGCILAVLVAGTVVLVRWMV